ncbi:MAG: formylglycine-generating enzyme family protein [bacterium]
MRIKSGSAPAVILGVALLTGFALALYASDGGKASGKKSAPAGMVHVPEGEFTMGMEVEKALQECRKFNGDKCKREEFKREAPAHQVWLDGYYIDKHEVTQAEYNKCVSADECDPNLKHDGFTGDKQPVVGVKWEGAKDYCEWVDKRLPTEAEWEKAARGTDERMYSWGNEFDGTKANFCDKNCEKDWACRDWDDGYAKTAPVGSYPENASPYGALDMTGNAPEWTADWYKEDYYQKSPDKNPKGPLYVLGGARVWRGGGFDDSPVGLQTVDRSRHVYPMDANFVGFRCAKDLK